MEQFVSMSVTAFSTCIKISEVVDSISCNGTSTFCCSGGNVPHGEGQA